jgi:hypothetical protein
VVRQAGRQTSPGIELMSRTEIACGRLQNEAGTEPIKLLPNKCNTCSLMS